MAAEIKIDKLGGEYKVDEGLEHYAMWIPVSFAEKEALVKKGEKLNVNPARLVANFLREWLNAGELSQADLAKVSGGAGMIAPTNQFNITRLQQGAIRPTSPQIPNLGDRMEGTVMCPW